MKLVFLLSALLLATASFAQSSVNSKKFGLLEFKELDHGLAQVVEGKVLELKKSPTGTRGWLDDFIIIEVSDTIQIAPKAKFGVIYVVNATDTVDIKVDIEWIYPEKITNEKGDKFKSFRYTTERPTNTLSASSYSLDAPYEMVKGNWTINIYIEKKKLFSRTFFLK